MFPVPVEFKISQIVFSFSKGKNSSEKFTEPCHLPLHEFGFLIFFPLFEGKGEVIYRWKIGKTFVGDFW